jgi:hypothetical protein
MKQFSNRLVSCCAAIVLVAGGNAAMAETVKSQARALPVVEQSSGDTGSFCLDGMETVPFSDDLEPTLAAVDGSCSVNEDIIIAI